jgi:hypothetical protein
MPHLKSSDRRAYDREYRRKRRASAPEEERAKHREYMRRWYAENPAHKARHLERVAANKASYVEEAKAVISEFKSNGCALCSEDEPCCLSAHHLDPSQKLFSVGEHVGKGVSAKRLIVELSKCICVCENCHRKIHAKLISLIR